MAEHQGIGYQKREIVAKLDAIGTFTENGKRYKLWGHMTFYCGPDTVAIAAKYDRVAPKDENGELVMIALKEGEIVVKPGFVYRIIPMTGAIMTEHLRAMRTWKPKVVYSYEKSDEAAVDLGVINPMGEA